MRLLTYNSNDNLHVTRDLTDSKVKPYAILSHTWGKDEDEVTFRDIGSSTIQQKPGYTKIDFCGKQARQDRWQYFWVDTCCIDKANHAELSKAITSMFRWYQQAQVCYVYLADVSSQPSPTRRDWQSALHQSRWFTRGWALQELLAPKNVVFYSKEWERLGTKDELKGLLHDITGIPISALEGQPLSQFPVIERMRWAQGRQTKREEDQAYCLLGIFGLHMYLNYGEGDYAFRRLKNELNVQFLNRITESVHDYSFRNPVGLCLGQAPSIERRFFVGRDHELEEMAKIVPSGDNIDKQCRLVLGGIGGIGKTQLALAYAQRYTQQYDSVFWLNATSKATLASGFQAIAKRIFSVPDYQAIDSRHFRDYVLNWLSHPRNTKWLLIFDNYDEPQTYDIHSFYPLTAHGTIIITTRRADLVAGEQINVRPLQNLNECLEILQTRSGRGNISNAVGASHLVERLAGFPLALVTAGTFLRKSVWTFQQYLDAYEEQWNIISRSPPFLTEYQDRTLYTTWDLSYNRLKEEEPVAAKFLKLFAYFNYQAIWYDLLHAGTRDDRYLPDWLLPIVNDSAEFESIIRILVDYCFIEAQVTTQTYSIHTCVHDWITASLNETIEPWSYWYAFHCIASSIDGEDWDSLGHVRYTRFTLHAVSLMNARFTNIRRNLVEAYMKAAEDIAELLRSQLQLSSAGLLLVNILTAKEEALGAEHMSTLDTVNNLGLLYDDQGKLPEAEQMYLRALAGREQVLGAEHTSTLDTVNNLGSLYRGQGKLAEAEQMYVRALAGYEKVLGAEHMSTLNTVNNLGLLYDDQGKLLEAEQIYLRALAGREQVLGAEHTSTLNTVNNLGSLYRGQGKLAEAEQMYVRALAGYEKVLGAEHMSTLDTVNNLGLLYADQGKLVEAEIMYERALAGKEKVFGPMHISTLNTITELGNLHHTQGKLSKAQRIQEQALAGYKTALGTEHPATLHAMTSLGNVYREQGKLLEAQRIQEQALAGYKTALGTEHPATLHAMTSLGNVYREQGKLLEAQRIQEQALAGYKTALGTEHPATLHAMTSLGNVYHGQERLLEAETMYQVALSGYEDNLASETVPALYVINSLGDLYAYQGKIEQAEQMYRRALAGRYKVLGPTHPSTETTRNRLDRLSSPDGNERELHDDSLSVVSTMVGSWQSNTALVEAARNELLQLFLEDEQSRSLLRSVVDLSDLGPNGLIRILTIHLSRFAQNLRKEVDAGRGSSLREACKFLLDNAARLAHSITHATYGELSISGNVFLGLHGQSSRTGAEQLLTQYLTGSGSGIARKPDKSSTIRDPNVPVILLSDPDDLPIDSDTVSTSSDSSASEPDRDSIPVLENLRQVFGQSAAYKLMKDSIWKSVKEHAFDWDTIEFYWREQEGEPAPLELRVASNVDVDIVEMEEAPTWIDLIKLSAEAHTGQQWDWWPLQAPRRRIPVNKVRLKWKCQCGYPQCKDIAPTLAGKIQNFTRLDHVRRKSVLKRDGPVQMGPRQQDTVARAQGELSLQPGSQSQPAVNTDPERAAVRSSLANESNILGPGGIQEQPQQGVSQQQKPASMMWILLCVKNGSDLPHEQIQISPNMNDNDFFDRFRLEYRRLRGLAFWYHPDQFHYCHAAKFSKWDVRQLAYHCNEMPDNLSYNFQPKPPSRPYKLPVPAREWEHRFHRNCSYGARDFLSLLPKRVIQHELDICRRREELWGLYVVHRTSARVVLFWLSMLLSPSIVMLAVWLKRHPEMSLQDAIVPTLVTLAAIPIFLLLLGHRFKGEIEPV